MRRSLSKRSDSAFRFPLSAFRLSLPSAFRLLHSESGQSLPLTAAVLAFVVVPLLALVIEVGRWVYVRNTLQHAADAAAAAASQAWDVAVFENTGVVQFDAAQADAAAQAAFAAGVTDAGQRRYQPSLSAWWLDESDHTAHVQAQASVTPLFPLAPAVVIQVSSVAQAGQEVVP